MSHFDLLSAISKSASNAVSTEKVFREIGRHLLSCKEADAVSMILYDRDLCRARELFVMTDEQHFERTTYEDLPFGGLSLVGTDAADLATLEEPTLASPSLLRNRLYKAGAPLHFFASYAQQVHLPLINKDLRLGTLTLHSKRPDAFCSENLSVFVVIARHLAIAMRLLAAEEEIKTVEEERTHLLSLGQALTVVREKSELSQVMQDQFRRLFPSGDIVICVHDQEMKTHSTLLFLPEPGRYAAPSPVTSATYPVDDGFYKQMLSAKNVQVFDTEDLIRKTRVPAYIRFLFDNGIREIAGVRLRSGHTTIGVLFVLCDRNQRLIPRQTIAMRAVSLHLSLAINNVLASRRLTHGLAPGLLPAPALASASTLKDTGMIGSSPALLRITRLISQVAASDSTILLLGETGTGKELVARAIHDNSNRRNNLLVKVNCAALPAGLIESELFGHEKGSFTGAMDRRIGKFELAAGGTLFLDEIGEMSMDLQVKLLRVLQEREIERVGGKDVIRTDVRIIAATNKQLQKEVLAGRFRSDLFYRLNVLPITLPALRERKEDIPALAAHFICKYARKTGKTVNNLSGRSLQDMMAYHWPGNIRELEHLIERSVLLASDGGGLEVEVPLGFAALDAAAGGLDDSRIRTLDEVGRDHILEVLKRCKGKVTGPEGAARLLNIPATTLNSKIRRLGIKRNFQ